MTMHIVKYLGGRIVKLVDFSDVVYFTVCLTALYVNAFNCSYRRLLLYYKAVGFYDTLFSKSPLKKSTLHSNELAEGYPLMSVTIFIDKYGGGDTLKFVVFRNFARFWPISRQKINPEKIQKYTQTSSIRATH